MKKSNLIDMFGLTGDPSSEDRLDDLLFRLESDAQNALEVNSNAICLSSAFTITISSSGSAVSFQAWR